MLKKFMDLGKRVKFPISNPHLLSIADYESNFNNDLNFLSTGSNIIEYKELEANDIIEEPRIKLRTEWTEQLTSTLTIEKLLPSDSGNYSCVPTMADAASVNVHVINGKKMPYTITIRIYDTEPQ